MLNTEFWNTNNPRKILAYEIRKENERWTVITIKNKLTYSNLEITKEFCRIVEFFKKLHVHINKADLNKYIKGFALK